MGKGRRGGGGEGDDDRGWIRTGGDTYSPNLSEQPRLHEITPILTKKQGDRIIRKIRHPLIISTSCITRIPTPRVTIESIEIDSLGIGSAVEVLGEGETILAYIGCGVAYRDGASGLFGYVGFHVAGCGLDPG